MPDYSKYQKSISNELISIKDRVRYFINDKNWGEDGRYKEIILSHVLRNHLTDNVSIGTGFVINNGKITKQIDILIYRNDFPVMFKQDNFVIVSSESVLGIIEVKSTINTCIAKQAIESAAYNGNIITRKIFNGIFAFGTSDSFSKEKIEALLNSSNRSINHICWGPDIFIKYWKGGEYDYERGCYAFYKIEKLSFGYFISNLIEHIHNELSGQELSKTLHDMCYSIEKTKEAYRI